MYPKYMEINGENYKINTDYRVALACLKAINDEEINGLLRIVKTSKSFSFFSGHATNSMASTVFMVMILFQVII